MPVSRLHAHSALISCLCALCFGPLANSTAMAMDFGTYASSCQGNGGTAVVGPGGVYQCNFAPSGAGGGTMQQQLMMQGAGIAGQAIGNAVVRAILGNPQEDAARQAAAAQAAEQQRQAALKAAAQQKQAAQEEMRQQELAKQRILGLLKDTDAPPDLALKLGDSADAPPLTVSATKGAFGKVVVMPAETAASPAISAPPADQGLQMKLGDAADKPESVPSSPANSASNPVNPGVTGYPDVAGSSLNTGIKAEVPAPTVADYMNRSAGFLTDRAREEVSRAALSGELLAEGEMGPYGMATAVMINVARLPHFVLSNIQAAARGDLTPQQAYGLTTQAVNRIFDFNSPVNQAVKDGVLQTARDQVQSQIEDQAKEGIASLATSYFPVADEVKSSIAETAPKLANDLQHWVKALNPSGQGEE
ncbi:MAG: hypothetical protein ACYC43_03110 [Burkholderiales bacterium]